MVLIETWVETERFESLDDCLDISAEKILSGRFLAVNNSLILATSVVLWTFQEMSGLSRLTRFSHAYHENKNIYMMYKGLRIQCHSLNKTRRFKAKKKTFPKLELNTVILWVKLQCWTEWKQVQGKWLYIDIFNFIRMCGPQPRYVEKKKNHLDAS